MNKFDIFYVDNVMLMIFIIIVVVIVLLFSLSKYCSYDI